MNISALLFHRSLGRTIQTSPGVPHEEDLSRVFTSFLYHDIDYDSSTRFTAHSSPKKGQELLRIKGHHKGVNRLGADETDGRWMASGGADGSILVWDLEQEEEEDGEHGDYAYRIQASSMVLENDRPDHGVSSIRFNPHNSSLFSTTSYSATLSLFSLTPTNPTCLQTYPLDSHLYTHSTSPASTSTALIAVAGSSPHIRLIDPRTSSASQTLFGHVSSVLSVAWSPLYSSILASGGQDGSLRIWDIRFGATCLGTLDMNKRPQRANRAAGRAHDSGVNGLAWSSDGRRIISAGMDGKIRVWGLENGVNTGVVFPPVVRNKYQAEFPLVVTESNEAVGGEMLWIGSEEQLLAFDLENGRMLKRVGIPKIEARDGVGRITGLVPRKNSGEIYTCHALRDVKKFLGGREGIARWRAKRLFQEEDVQVEQTEKQKKLQDIFEKATRAPVTFS
ncbi:hypothetical protein TWF481_012276 [Arthrobotrys musiformis]|uniref:WD40 repeat-like protein n=1 Tax=Arthrobotrys musiformis TaxID=47236 RepID=A0AAV9VWT1_9PEZI